MILPQIEGIVRATPMLHHKIDPQKPWEEVYDLLTKAHKQIQLSHCTTITYGKNH
jgi:hypothetical protein